MVAGWGSGRGQGDQGKGRVERQSGARIGRASWPVSGSPGVRMTDPSGPCDWGSLRGFCMGDYPPHPPKLTTLSAQRGTCLALFG